MTPPEEVNSDKNDDIDSFFTVQNPTSLGCSVILPVSTAVRVCQIEYPASSLAPCERLFSSAGQIFTPKRATISDVNFERQLLLMLNNKSRR